VSTIKLPDSSLLLEQEKELWQSGFSAIAGVDEVGRGPLAGPVVACACILPKWSSFHGVKDSKSLTPTLRKQIAHKLTNDPNVTWALGIVTHEEIDQINILRATLLAMKKAIEALLVPADFVLVDGRDCPETDLPCRAIIKGDTLSQSIAAASIIAKVHRDGLMEAYHEVYPEYGFDSHKGYGTKAHLKAIATFGPTPIHRKSFAPFRS
jgi:ribonuclease HII